RLPKDRVPFTAIVDRPPLKLPGGARMAVWVIVNVEDWGIERPMPRTVLPPPMGVPMLPDLPNWAWHEYGMRVGFWRIHEVLARHGVIPTLAINGIVCKNYPRVAQAGKDAGWEFMGHGYMQGPMHKLEDQRAAIRDTVNVIKEFTGKPPVGWESPGLTETYDTIDILAEEGIKYVADWVLDDQPVKIATTTGHVVSVPYTVELNDIPMGALQHMSQDDMVKRGQTHFDQLYKDSEKITRVMAISVHPYLSGSPHRIGWLDRILAHVKQHDDVVIWTGEQIYNWYEKQ
ncbi:MAG TPA: polysaccharide deacetylase family protein, partial [Burkholderiales bacterium]